MSKNSSQRTGHSTNLSRLIAQVVKPVMRKQGFYDIDIISDWAYIVGSQWADLSMPKKLSFNPKTKRSGTLHIQVVPGANVLIQHIEPEIIDRINTYFGFEAVKKLKIIHGLLPVKSEPLKEEEHKEQLAPLPEVDGIEDQNLKEALQRYGQALAKNTLG